MSLHRFFLERQILSSEPDQCFELELAADDAKHAKVLRLDIGEHIAVIDADQDYFECEIISYEGNLPIVKICQKIDTAPSFDVTLFQGLAKADKMETVVRHATELGVSHFVPLACERSVVKISPAKQSSKIDRWQSIAKSAAMQSGQLRVPDVANVVPSLKCQDAIAAFDCVLICWEEAQQTCSLNKALQVSGFSGEGSSKPASDFKVAILVGPEGGFSEKEIKAFLASNSNAHLVSLGPSILRTETAGIVASALCIYELGGLGRTFEGQ